MGVLAENAGIPNALNEGRQRIPNADREKSAVTVRLPKTEMARTYPPKP